MATMWRNYCTHDKWGTHKGTYIDTNRCRKRKVILGLAGHVLRARPAVKQTVMNNSLTDELWFISTHLQLVSVLLSLSLPAHPNTHITHTVARYCSLCCSTVWTWGCYWPTAWGKGRPKPTEWGIFHSVPTD